MKKVKLVLIITLVATIAKAQSSDNEIQMLQSIFGMQKKEMAKQAIQIPEGNEIAIWALYDEYEVKRKELGKQRLEGLEEYAEKYYELEGEVLQEMIKKSIKLNNSFNKLIASYTKKIQKAANEKTAFQFYQLESYILSLIRVELLETFPFVGEFEKE
jgi:hypothetical protein